MPRHSPAKTTATVSLDRYASLLHLLQPQSTYCDNDERHACVEKNDEKLTLEGSRLNCRWAWTTCMGAEGVESSWRTDQQQTTRANGESGPGLTPVSKSALGSPHHDAHLRQILQERLTYRAPSAANPRAQSFDLRKKRT